MKRRTGLTIAYLSWYSEDFEASMYWHIFVITAATTVIKIIVMSPVLSVKCLWFDDITGGERTSLKVCEIVWILSSIGSTCGGPWKGMITGTLNCFNIFWKRLLINISIVIIIFSRAIRNNRVKNNLNEILLKHSSSS